MATSYKQNDRVALASDIKYRGKITQVILPYTAGDETYYNISWDNDAPGMYADSVLMGEKAAKELEKVEKDKGKMSFIEAIKSIF